MSDLPKIVRDADEIHWWVFRIDGERVRFTSYAAAQSYIDHGHHFAADQERYRRLRSILKAKRRS
jgi:hypothetical protein